MLLAATFSVGCAIALADDWSTAARDAQAWRDRVRFESIFEVSGQGALSVPVMTVVESSVCWDTTIPAYYVRSRSIDYDLDGNVLNQPRARIEALGADYHLRVARGQAKIDRDHETAWRSFLTHPDSDSFLEGCLLGNNGRFVTDLLMEVERETQMVSETEFRVTGDTRFGHIEIVLDPSRDYLLTEYTVKKKRTHFFDDELLGDTSRAPGVPATETWRGEVRDVRFEQYGRYWVPVAGTMTLILSLADGSETRIIHEVTRSDIVIGADCPFPTDIVPDGSTVIDMDRPGWPYIWRDGPELASDSAVVSGIDTVMSDYRASGNTSGGEELLRQGSDPLCGLYCLYAATHLIRGGEISFNDLLLKQGIQHPDGVTIGDLSNIAATLGFATSAHSNLTVSDLKRASCPFILHTRARASSEEPDHFVLLLDHGPDGVIIFDPPTQSRAASVRLLPLIELRNLWRGDALAVAQDTSELPSFIPTQITRIAVMGIAALAFLAIVRWASQRISRCAGQAGVLVGLASLVALGNAFLNTGMLSAAGLKTAADIHDKIYVGTVSIDQLAAIVRGDEDVIIIDARSRAEYDDMHIPDARLLPHNAPFQVRQQALLGVDATDRILVYCNPGGCPLAPRLARTLRDDGFLNVQVITGHWDEWIQKQ